MYVVKMNDKSCLKSSGINYPLPFIYRALCILIHCTTCTFGAAQSCDFKKELMKKTTRIVPQYPSSGVRPIEGIATRHPIPWNEDRIHQ